MTLLVGVFCADGIVIAGDRMATRGSMAQPTVGSAVTKVAAIKNGQALFAFSGFTGLGQIITQAIDKHLDLSKPYYEAVISFQPTLRQIMANAYKMANVTQQFVPGSHGEAICACLLAASFTDGLKLIEISPQGAFDIINGMHWGCLGSGQANADPFMHFLWNVYWRDRSPNTDEAAVTAQWAINTVIQAGTSGVGFNIDVLVLKNNGNQIIIKKLTQAELSLNEEFIDSAIEGMREQRNSMVPAPSAQSASEAPPDLAAEEA